MKRILFAVLATAVAATVCAADFSDEITPEQVLRVMNEYRTREGLAPLHAEEKLMLAAADRMRHMEEEAFWSHESPDGMAPFVWVRRRAYDYSAVGENLAAGFETTRLLVEAWMESPGHRANIMSSNYEDCGIAIIDGATTGPASGKSIVVLFGRKMTRAVTYASAD